MPLAASSTFNATIDSLSLSCRTEVAHVSVRVRQDPVACSPKGPRVKSNPDRDPTLAWLLAGDPAIRWQVLRDLTGATPGLVERERRRVAGRFGTWAAL